MSRNSSISLASDNFDDRAMASSRPTSRTLAAAAASMWFRQPILGDRYGDLARLGLDKIRQREHRSISQSAEQAQDYEEAQQARHVMNARPPATHRNRRSAAAIQACWGAARFPPGHAAAPGER